MPDTLPNMERTEKALHVYDMHQWTFTTTMTNAKINAWFEKEKKLGQAVGEAFGHDTSDRNNFDTCRDLVRPGDFVRGCVKKWKESQ